jgi:hypothetical protein
MYCFIGSEANLRFPDGHSICLDEYGQRVDLTEEERELFPRAPLLTEDNFAKCGFEPFELTAYPSSDAAVNAPSSYWIKRLKAATLLAAEGMDYAKRDK